MKPLENAVGCTPEALEPKTLQSDIDSCNKNVNECLHLAVCISQQLLGYTVEFSDIVPKLENDDIVAKIDFNKTVSNETMNMLNNILSRI